MKIYQDDQAGIDLHADDLFAVLPTLAAGSIDACVTDPPYGLAFMGKEWDSFKGGDVHETVAFQAWCARWGAEVLRVLKPGGHIVAFGGTRMFHRLTCGLEDAGFEIRDCLSWLYGSGFPKSLDVTKAIDRGYRKNEADDAFVWQPASGPTVAVYAVTAFVRAARDAAGVTNKQIDDLFGFNGMAGHWTSSTSQPSVPTWPQWEQLKELLAFGDALDDAVLAINGGKGDRSIEGTALADREVLGTARGKDAVRGDLYAPGDGEYIAIDYDVTAPRTAAGKTFDGWGTALKPGWEPIVLGRKPFPGTVAGNLLVHRTGAINVRGCRLGDESMARTQSTGGVKSVNNSMAGANTNRIQVEDEIGRWPANVLLDEEAAAILDDQSGTSTSSRGELTLKPGTVYGGRRQRPPSRRCHGW